MTKSRVPRHPVFVVGMPRSGTTLLSSLLDAHPDLVIAPETHYFTRCWPGGTIDSWADVEQMLARLDQQPGVHDMALSDAEWDAIRDQLRVLEVPTHGDILRVLIETYAARSGVPAWGEKTPDHLRKVPEMARQFPNAVFLAIIRDPRDVVLSLQNLPWSRRRTPEQAWTWRTYAALVDRYRTNYKRRFFALRYEDLIETPKACLQDVCAFLETPFYEAMLQPRQREDQHFDADREPWKRKSAREIDASNREKWRAQMPEAERVVVDVITGRWLSAYEYPRPSIRWRPALIGRILQRLGTATLQRARRTLRKIRSGRAFSNDAAPRWTEE
ncbi:sulfotransferase family protein [Salinibacter grassmerensis]|uniref:sulfotransferase family protein n=1 Tax=Salinibacter grassmerensis TaxID=3040353 RepID=UPI0021E71B7D|nr:sulfotransferase [Salinibacter grassmerensis]